MNPTDAPMGVIHAAGAKNREEWRKEGMLMSLSLCDDTAATNGDGGTNVLGCGMESGSIFFHDLAMMGSKAGVRKSITSDDGFCHGKDNFTSVKLGNDPILCLDSYSSCDCDNSCTRIKIGQERKEKYVKPKSIITIAGIAGDAAEVLALPAQE